MGLRETSPRVNVCSTLVIVVLRHEGEDVLDLFQCDVCPLKGATHEKAQQRDVKGFLKALLTRGTEQGHALHGHSNSLGISAPSPS